MKKSKSLEFEFVNTIPAKLNDGKLYLSMDYSTAVHKCCCGCGKEVVTPLTPTDWKMTYDGETVSLCPSIGNWSFACKSHYWIVRNKVRWADEWSEEQITAGRQLDRLTKDGYFGIATALPPGMVTGRKPGDAEPGKGLFAWLKHLWSRL